MQKTKCFSSHGKKEDFKFLCEMFWWWVTFDGREQPNEQVLHTTHHIIMCLKCYYNSFTLLHIIFFSRWQDYDTPNNHHSESNYQVYYFFLIHYIYIIVYYHRNILHIQMKRSEGDIMLCEMYFESLLRHFDILC